MRFSRYSAESIYDMGWTELDAMEQLAELQSSDFIRTETSIVDELTIWVFTPYEPWFDRLWIRLVERQGMVVISFHQG